MNTRRGLSVLALVLVVCTICAVVAFAHHALWRGSARTQFSAQELRLLSVIARSSIAEAAFEIQRALDQGHPEWTSFMRMGPLVRTITPAITQGNASLMGDGSNLAYSVDLVGVCRVVPLARGAPAEPIPLGVVDLTVKVSVERQSPRHRVALVVSERRHVRMADDLGPYAVAGKHAELSVSPVATTLEGDVQ